MQLWFRLILYFLRLPFTAGLTNLFSKSVLHLRVLPTDLDLNMHMTNSRYLTMMDMGRIDHMCRTKLGKAMMRHKWTPLANHATLRFRRELPLWEPFRLESEIVYWTEDAAIIEQRFIFTKGHRKNIVAATGLVRVSMYDRAKKQKVPITTVCQETDTLFETPVLQPHIEAFLKEEKAIQTYERKSAGLTTQTQVKTTGSDEAQAELSQTQNG